MLISLQILAKTVVRYMTIDLSNNLSKYENQIKIIAKHFIDIFWKDAELMPDLRPTVMSNSFTSGEIKKVVSKMKMNKSPGYNEIPTDLIMYAPD